LRWARDFSRALATERRRQRGDSDRERWAGEGELLEAWDRRTARLAALVPAGSRVIEFGAARMTLRDHLPPGCTYTPSDLVSRGPGTLVADLNARPLPDVPEADVAVFGGVLEYLNDVSGVLWHLHPRVHTVIASYVPVCGNGWVWRRSQGWVNDFDEDELRAQFLRGGYYPLYEEDFEEPWARQRLVRAARQHVRLAIVRG
jgi:hypothetical protein